MSAHTKTSHTSSEHVAKVTIELSKNKKYTSYIPLTDVDSLKEFLGEHSATSDKNTKLLEWKVLSKDRIEKYKKSGIVLRGARYRENISQKLLAEKSGVSQNEISKIENGKRTVGEKVAKRLAKVLNIDYRLLIEP